MGVPAQELRPVWQRLGRTIDPTAVAEALQSLHVGAAAPVSKEDAAPAPEVGASSSGEAFEEKVALGQGEGASSRTSAGQARVGCPFNGAIQWATSCIDSAAALPAAVFVHRRDACEWSR